MISIVIMLLARSSSAAGRYNRSTGLAAALLEHTPTRPTMSGSPAPQTTTPNTVGISGFFADPGFDFVTRSMIGYAAQGVMDVGRVFATDRPRPGRRCRQLVRGMASDRREASRPGKSKPDGGAHGNRSQTISFCLRKLRAGHRFCRWTDGPHYLCAGLCPADGMLGGIRRHVGQAN